MNNKVDDPFALYGSTNRANELIAHSSSHMYGLNTKDIRKFTISRLWGWYNFSYKIIKS